MTAGTAPPQPGHDQAREHPPATESECLIDRRIRQTRRQIKSVDLWTGLVALAAGTLAYLLAGALVDHWLVPGGLGFLGRLLLFALLVIAGGAFVALRLVPLAIHRVNPVFAAQSIEQSRPSLKNSLINFLYLRGHRKEIEHDRLATGIYRGLEQRTAADLEQIPPDMAVDRGQLIRLGYVLGAILAACCLYLVVSPKSPIVSFRRIIWPWADIKAPTRVTIEEVAPGDRRVFQGQIVHVSAKVEGLADDEPVMLYYSTADGQSVDQAVPMTLAEERSRYAADLPPGRFGLQQNAEYYLVAGDCRTPRFRLDVQTALSIVVDRVEYDYPDYTGIPDRIDQRVADLKAVEGTRVRIRAGANQEIRSCAIELDCDPRHALRMTVAGPQTAEAGFTLWMDRNAPDRAEYGSYQVRFTDTAGRQNHTPVRHRIEVIPDLAPEIRFLNPLPTEFELPNDAVLELRVRAVDPDFALRRVALRAEEDHRSLSIRALLEKERPEPAHEGPFQATYRFQPAEFELEAGDKVIYWAEAEDNMFWGDDRPDGRAGSRGARRGPNRSETARRWITITPPEGRSTPPSRGDPPHQAPEQPGTEQPAADQPGSQATPEEPEKGADRTPTDTSGKGQPDDSEQPGQKGQDQGQTAEQSGQSEQTKQGEQTDENGQSGQGEQSGQGQSGQGGQQASGEQQASKQGQAGGSGAEDAQQPSQQSGEGSGEKSPGQGATGGEGTGRPSAGKGQSGQQPGTPSSGDPRSSTQPIDGQTNPGDAFEEILRHLDDARQSDDGTSGPAAKPSGQQGVEPGLAAQQKSGEPTDSARPPAKQPTDRGKASDAAQSQPDQGADQPDAERPGRDEPADQPSDDRPVTAEKQPGGEGQAQSDRGKPSQGEVGSSSGKQGDRQRMPDNDPGATQGPGSKPEAEQGAQAKGPGEPTEEKPFGQGRETPDAQGGDPQQSKGQGGAGKPSAEQQASPSPQEASQQRNKRLGPGDQSEPGESESGQSPSNSPKDSDSQGDTSGDRSGGGEQGGGQKSPQSGTGAAGTHTASEQGGSQSAEEGEGPTGPNAGDRVEAARPTGRPSDQGGGAGASQRDRPGSQAGDGVKQDGQSGASSSDGSDWQPPSEAGPQGPHDRRRGVLSSTPGAGGGSDQAQGNPPPGKPRTYRREDPNLDFAQRQTNLALEYLDDQLAKDQPDQALLDRLGWTKEDLKRFYDQWNRMRQEATRSESARTELDDALDSLGLRPRGPQSSGGRTETDTLNRLREGLRSDPPPDRADAYRAYRRGVSGRKP